MKVLQELNEEVEVITEDVEGSKRLFIHGVFLQSNIVNRNKRLYPKHIMDAEVNRYINEKVEKDMATGEAGHPNGPTINVDRISHKITSLKEDGNNWVGKALIIPTPMGNIVRTLMEAGVRLGVSSRAIGDVKRNRQGINEVQTNFRLSTAADIVTDPSAPDAFVQSIHENQEWVMKDGIWTPEEHDEARRLVESAHRSQIEEIGLNLFNQFLSKL